MLDTRPALFTLIAIVVFSTAACGAGNDDADVTAAEVGDIDNCTLVTDDEASSLAGVALTHTEDGALGCGYVREGRTMSEFTVRALRGKGAARDNFGSHSADTTVHEIPGVGDSAAVLARGDDVNFIIVQRGPRYVQFVTTFIDDLTLGSPKLKEAQELALKALDRME